MVYGINILLCRKEASFRKFYTSYTKLIAWYILHFHKTLFRVSEVVVLIYYFIVSFATKILLGKNKNIRLKKKALKIRQVYN